jgi:hypothetical protein
MRTFGLFVHGCLVAGLLAGCPAPEAQGLRRADPGEGAQVRFDVFTRPLPEIPLPNDIATRFDPSSPTGRRLNASMVAPTAWERAVRADLAKLDGWGTFAPISVSFTRPLDVEVIFERHRDDYAFENDAVLVVDVTPGSPDLCAAMPLDLGEGNFPLTLERSDYYPNDPRNHTGNLLFEEVDEDHNGNGVLDPGEDTDMDGVLDKPNLHEGELLTFYERETQTLILRPLMPLRENTTYAVVLTRRLKDEAGHPVRSPFDYINHTAQTEALRPLPGCLERYGLTLEDVAFTWPFTTQSITRDFVAIRDGMYGHGPMAWLQEKYPARVEKLHRVRKDGDNLFIVPGAHFLTAAADVMPLIGGNNPQLEKVLESHRFIDFHAVGSFVSPQFFPREDADGAPLPLHQQSWRLDPVTGEAFHRPETVTFWLTMPRKDIAQRPVPVVILGHGYTGNKLDPLIYGGYFARHGVATIGMEAVSHGIELAEEDRALARGVFAGKDLELMFDAVMQDRAFDQNADRTKDSGADFWTAYAFHTRDVVRQSAVDYMRLIQILRSFDGQRTWTLGSRQGIAGDFDGDGEVDVGGPHGSISFTGGSLGGIMASVLGGAEPALDTAIPVAGGGGLTDVGIRSIQGGVAEAVNLRMMGPLLLSLRGEGGRLELWQYLPDRNKVGRAYLGVLHDAQISEGDTAVVRNLRSGEHRCARVQKDGLFRVAVSSDQDDPLQLELHPGPLPPGARSGCSVPAEPAPYLTVQTLGEEVVFHGRKYPQGSALLALGDGFGLRRNSPETRRFHAIAQVILDPADPVNWAPYFEQRTLRYAQGEQVRTRALVINTIGDMNVPMSTGAAISRAAGFVPWARRDPRHAKTPNQVLIDTGALEAVEGKGRHRNAAGQPVLMDLEHLALIGDGTDGFDVPRLSPPLRLVGPSERAGGQSGTLFPFVHPTGRHGFDPPDPNAHFDLGSLMANVLGRYVQSRGTILSFEPCQVDWSCEWLPPVPPAP